MPPSSSRYYVGSITSGLTVVWLTSDQTDTGTPAKIELTGDDAFADGDLGETLTPASDGTIHSQAVALGLAGIAFEIKILFCPVALYTVLVAMLSATRGSTVNVRVQLSSVKRSIDVLARANGNNWLATGTFSGSIIRDVTFRLLSIAPGS